MKDYRQIGVSLSGSKVALGAFEKHVKIIDLVTKETQAEFETILDYGGHRLSFVNSGFQPEFTPGPYSNRIARIARISSLSVG